LQSQLGHALKVIIEKDGMAKSENFLDIKINVANAQKAKVGDIVEVLIKDVDDGFLVGEI
ncbi:MAG TPA: TRAM domain-containing protein, partial [Rickettsiales bacterium]|nr:TRAM domain-containing protein [Rickettsiales bacterium]